MKFSQIQSLSTILISALLGLSDAFIFELAPAQQKCFTDIVGEQALMVTEYQVQDLQAHESPAVAVTLTSPENAIEYSKENEAAHKFALTASDEGVHKLCFVNKAAVDRRVSLEFKTGVEANDYAEIARKEHLKPLELELKKLEDKAQEIYKSQLHQRNREERHRTTNESTNSRVMWFSFLSVVVAVSLGAWQLTYLHKFFKSQKLI